VKKEIKMALDQIDSTDIMLDTLSLGMLTIQNFKSIDSYELDLSKLGKLNQITGNIGTGKSSIINALDFVLKGGKVPLLTKIGSSGGLKVTLSYKWNNTEYYIERAKGSITLYQINGEDQHGSIRELDKLFNQDNPWLSVWTNFMSISQFSPGFLISMSDKDRAAFLGKLLGYDKFLTVNGTLTGMLREAKRATKAADANRIAAKALREESESKVIGLDLTTTIQDQAVNSQRLMEAQADYKAQSDLLNSALAYETQQTTLSGMTKTRELVEAEHLAAQQAATLTQEHVETAQSVLDLYAESQSEIEKGKTLGAKVSALFSELDAGVCVRCNQELHTKDDLIAEHAAAESELTSFREVYMTKSYPTAEQQAEAVTLSNPFNAQQATLTAAIGKLNSLPAQPDLLPAPEFDSGIYKTKADEIQSQITSFRSTETQLAAQVAHFSDLDKKVEAHAATVSEVETATLRQGVLSEAVVMTSTDGKLTAGFLSEAARVLSDGEVSVTTSDGAKSTFEVKLLVDGLGDIPYDMLSGGQRAKVDLILISRMAELVGGLPILILDESLKFLSGEAAIEIVDGLRQSQINNIVIVSHGAEIPQIDNVIEPPAF
jgi:DNA repair exonuclease SbcCD ATPase subunit